MTLSAADLDYLRAGLDRGERLHPLALSLGYQTSDALVAQLLKLVDQPALGCEAPSIPAALPAYTTQRAWIVALLRAGKSLQAILAEVGCNRQAVYDVRAAERKAGRTLPVPVKPPAPIGKLPLQEVIDRYQSGETLTSLAAATGLTDNGVRWRLRQAGMQITRQRVRARQAATETTPPGASAAVVSQQHSAGTAAAYRGATGQPLNGPDEAPPLREVGEGAGAPKPANAFGQSGRPTPSPLPLPPLPRPSAAPTPPTVLGSARDLAAIAAAAAASGAIKVTQCPTAAVADTTGARIKPEDAAQVRRHTDALLSDAHLAAVGRGRRAAYKRSLSMAGRASA